MAVAFKELEAEKLPAKALQGDTDFFCWGGGAVKLKRFLNNNFVWMAPDNRSRFHRPREEHRLLEVCHFLLWLKCHY